MLRLHACARWIAGRRPLRLARQSPLSRGRAYSRLRPVSCASGSSLQFCRACGSRVERRIPEGDSRERDCCTSSTCNRIEYTNPKNVVGVIAEDAEGRVLLCRRAIEPCRGMWTLPAGFQEMGESTSQGAAREAREETGVDVDVVAPFIHIDIPAISQAYVLFSARLLTESTGPEALAALKNDGESLEVALFERAAIPWGNLAFTSVRVALETWSRQREAGGDLKFTHATISKKPGSAPGDHKSFLLENVMTSA